MPNIDEIRIVGQEITYDIRPKEDTSHQNVSAEEKATWNAKSDFSGNYADLQGKPDLSQFVTKVVDDLTNYYLKSETFTKQEVQQLLSSLNSGVFKIVDTLPTASAATTGLKIYLVPSQNQEAQNVKDEFITIEENGSYRWEQIGSTAMSLDGYVTETALNQALSSYVTSSAFTSALAQKQDKLVSGENIKTVNGESILGSGNIVAGDPNAIKYTEQSLTDSQKTQARTNIGAAAASALTALETAIEAKYSKPASGIPEADLNSNVQSALALARTSIQSLAEYYNKTEIDALLAAVNSEQYVDVTTLPTASASTLGKIYLVGPDTNGVYTRHYTSYDGSTYSWVAVGTTEINLANYATKAELDQLGQEVDDIFKKANSDEYIDAVVDKDGRIIEATKEDGTKIIQKLETPGFQKFNEIETTEFIDAVVDSNQRVVTGIKRDGTFFAQKFSSPYLEAAVKPLAGKKWAVLGDSFTAGDTDSLGVLDSGKYAGRQACYAYLIGNRTEMDVISFFGGGRTLAYPATPGNFVNSVTCPTQPYYYQNIPEDADYITIYLGINDEHHAPGSSGGDGEDNTGVIPLGTATDSTTATYYGAWNVVLTWLRTNRPFSRVGIIVSNGCPNTYATATREMAKKYGYPILDLNGDERTPAMIRSSNPDIPYEIRDLITRAQAVDYDGTQTGTQNWHPNEEAHLFESFFIESFLKSI